jgi:hypothetical protein
MTFVLAVALAWSITAPVVAQEAENALRLQQEAEQAFNERDYAKAETLFRRLADLREATVGSEHADTVWSLFYLGLVFELQGKNAETNQLLPRSKSLELLWVIEQGNAPRALELLEAGADANAQTPYGYTALMYASLTGQTHVMNQLVARGADVNRKTPKGVTALLQAVKFGDPEAVRLLLSNGADPNPRDGDGLSALKWARLRLSMAPPGRSVVRMAERLPSGDLSYSTKEELREVIELLKKAGAKE